MIEERKISSLRQFTWTLGLTCFLSLISCDFISWRAPFVVFLFSLIPLVWSTLLSYVACKLHIIKLKSRVEATKIKSKGFKTDDMDTNQSPLSSKNPIHEVTFFGELHFMMKTVAWSVFALSLGGAMIVLMNPSLAQLQWIHSSIGVLGFTAHALMDLSIDRVDASYLTSNKLASSTDVDVGLLFYLKRVIGLGISLVSLGIFIYLDWMDQHVDRTLHFWIGSFGFFVSTFIAHIICGRVDLSHKGFKTFQPFRGGFIFVTMQGCAWFLFGLFCYIGFEVNQKPLGGVNISGIYTIAGVSGFASQVLLFLSIPNFSPNNVPTEHPQSNHILFRFLFIADAIATSLYLYLLYNQSSSVEIPAMILFVTLPPLTHILGTYIHEPKFKIYQPFVGGINFVILTAFGWIMYSLFLLGLSVRYFSSESNIFLVWKQVPALHDVLILLAPLPIASMYCLYVSLHLFSADIGPSPLKRRFPISFNFSYFGDYTSIMLAVFAIVFGLAAIYSSTISFTQASLKLSLVFWIGAFFMMHTSNCHIIGIPIFFPFSGPMQFVILQALGWTLFGVIFLLQLVFVLGSEIRDLPLFISNWISLLAGTQFVAFGLLRSSFSFFKADDKSKSSKTAYLPPLFTNNIRVDLDDMDIQELAEIIDKKSKSKNVLSILEHIMKERKYQSSKSLVSAKESIVSVISGGVVVLLAHISLAAFAAADIIQFSNEKQYSHQFPSIPKFLIISGILMSAISIIVPNLLIKEQLFQRFKSTSGGFQYLCCQFIGWSLVLVFIAGIGFLNYFEFNVSFPFALTGVGLISYTAQIVLVASILWYNPTDDNSAVQGLSYPSTLFSFGGNFHLLLGFVSVLFFLGLDFVAVNYGLERNSSLYIPISICAMTATLSSVPLLYLWNFDRLLVGVTMRDIIFQVIGCTVWTFSALIAIILIIDRFRSEDQIVIIDMYQFSGQSTMNQAYMSTKASIAGFLAQFMILLGSGNPGAAWKAVGIAYIATLVFVYVFLPLLRALLDNPMWYYAYYFKYWSWSISPDGEKVFKNVRIVRNIEFGSESDDVMDIMEPDDEAIKANTKKDQAGNTIKRHPPIVYCHGGGHIVVKREILHHSVTPFCRNGISVFSVEYPASPEARFPKAIFAVLRACSWVKKYYCPQGCYTRDKADRVPKRCESCSKVGLDSDNICQCCVHHIGTDEIQLLGDSAGGNLASYCAALICNQKLREEVSVYLSEKDQEIFKHIDLPKVKRLACVYGLLGRDILWGSDEENSRYSILHKLLLSVGDIGVRFLFTLYEPDVQNGNFPIDSQQPRVTITDLGKDDLVSFPSETLLLCGTSDPLLPTNKHCAHLLNQSGHKCELYEYPGTHGFHGLPSQWTLGTWVRNALPATRKLQAFFTSNEFVEPPESEGSKMYGVEVESLPRDYSPLIVFPVVFISLGFSFVFAWNLTIMLFQMILS